MALKEGAVGSDVQEVQEVVLFKLQPGVAREDFLRAAAPTDAWLQRQPGMIERTLLAPTPGGDTWVDTVRWRSLEDAEAAAAAFPQEQDNHDFESMIDPATAQMLRLQPLALGA
jgi:heme-degrading monooxygenase HmoA